MDSPDRSSVLQAVILKTDEKTAKYLNSPESEIYHKSDILYGLFFARQAILKSDKCFLVEGYTDVISLHQSGIENVVASSGTSLTINQIRLIKRFTHNITILYDGDEAGIKASLRGIDLLLEEGLNVRVVLLPNGEDPDSFARKNNSQAFTGFILAHEADFISFKTNLLRKEAESDPIKRAGLISEIVRTISVIPESIARSVYIRECSKLLDVDEKILYAETARLRNNRNEQKIRQADVKEYTPPVERAVIKAELIPENYPAEKEVIRLILLFGNQMFSLPRPQNPENEMRVVDYLLHEIQQDELEFHHPVFNQFYTEIRTQSDNREFNFQEYFVRHSEEALSKTAADMITVAHDLSKIWKRRENIFETEEMKLKENIPGAILAFKNEKLLKLFKDAENELRYAQEQDDQERIKNIQLKFMILNSLKMEISKELGHRTFLI